MSAKYDKSIGMLFTPEILKEDSVVRVVLECEFDRMVDEDILVMESEQKIDAHYRKMCIIRTVAFPVDILTTLCVLGVEHAKHRFHMQKAMVKYIFKKIDREELITFLVKAL